MNLYKKVWSLLKNKKMLILCLKFSDYCGILIFHYKFMCTILINS